MNNVGFIENAGYNIILYECYTMENGNRYYVVLGEHPSQKVPSRYVTWESTNLTSFYWGHYYNNQLNARSDYHERLFQLYEVEKTKTPF